jgi:hypothetical protein
MLAHPTLDQLHALGLHGLAKGFKELEHKPEARSLDHAEWLGLLLEYELTLPDAAAQLVIESTLDARARTGAASDDPRVGSGIPRGHRGGYDG